MAKTKYYALKVIQTLQCKIKEIIKVKKSVDQNEHYELTSVQVFYHGDDIYKAVISRKESSIQEYAVHQLKPVTEPMFDMLMADDLPSG